MQRGGLRWQTVPVLSSGPGRLFEPPGFLCLCVCEFEIVFVGALCDEALVDHGGYGAAHGLGVLGLEDVPAHVHAPGALAHGPPGHFQGLGLRQLLAAGYDYGDGEEPAGIAEGTIKITNTKQSAYTLPETGGVGSATFIIAGLLLVGMSGVGYLYIERKRRKGGHAH